MQWSRTQIAHLAGDAAIERHQRRVHAAALRLTTVDAAACRERHRQLRPAATRPAGMPSVPATRCSPKQEAGLYYWSLYKMAPEPACPCAVCCDGSRGVAATPSLA